MMIKYNIDISPQKINQNLSRLLNQVYKLLPSREEGIDWKRPLETIIEEFVGMNELFLDYHDILFSLLCKLEGLFILDKESDFQIYRRVIFECLGIIGELQKICQDQMT